MKLGLSGPFSRLPLAGELGFDYFEVSISELAGMDEAAFAAALAEAERIGLPVYAGNGLIPRDIELVGPQADLARTEQYLRHALGRMRLVGCRTVVLGSGKRRTCPEGFSPQTARRQLAEACALLGEVAQENGMTAVLEPLCSRETNTINTVEEGAALVREVGHPAFRLLADYYHMTQQGEDVQSLQAHADLLFHVHVASPGTRGPMHPEARDCEPLFAALSAAGYRGALSFEGLLGPDQREELGQTLRAMRALREKFGLRQA